jgi:hypothetical protein
MPKITVFVPPAMFATMLVIGATVVAMVSTPATGAPSSHPTEATLLLVVVPHDATTPTIAIATMDLRIEFMFLLYMSAP